VDQPYIVFIVAMFLAQFAALMCAHLAQKWLTLHDPGFRPPSMLMNLAFGRIITSFGLVSRYGRLRGERGEPRNLVRGFWLSFAATLASAVGLITFLMTH
jgi:hypothetical protein